ncbi:MAG: S-adenosylmethionine:tRNA ribosyltransferase-isomerase [Bacteroidota bacterium]
MKNIKLTDYTYDLPHDRIASYGLKNRDHSKLLFYNKGQINHHQFGQIPDLIPENATLFFNNTKVIPARLNLKRQSGASIEVFLLEPANPDQSIHSILNVTGSVEFKCMIGNLKKWRDNEKLYKEIAAGGQSVLLNVSLIDRDKRIVNISWENNEITFGEIIESSGHTPLPPYIKREDEPEDRTRYQTVYSKIPGAVAAPTAGLHFTSEVFENLAKRSIKTDYLTLHVSAGTFQPIKEEIITNHPMHLEQVVVSKHNLENLLDSEFTIAVGTTSMRTMESIYWYGVQLLNGNSIFHIDKLSPYSYQNSSLPSKKESIREVLNYMDANQLNTIHGNTEIFILPGYDFKICNGLITNYHQPGSTLILLVAAFVGENWRNIYKEALNNNYRFLSYGDSSLLLPYIK